MRKLLTTIFLLAPLSIMIGCNGDHSDRTVRDTAKNVHDSVPSNIDTSKTTTATGDAGTLDNSASGGTKVAKDSGKMAQPTAKKQ
ncbi:hypothetical protein [Mucilaginibacter aquaedulcis]|uniref:hypothetical protein n=1 Tax=Mucilaginibacter aquaedulcis TaxID=1187081 RepID=UPI0025B37700|nr:hypothetical protein [Mucilaginibacter aquaedulcis]MDN3551155.1 hypothetical protein [Mucilaginibacter aquaedulcis]